MSMNRTLVVYTDKHNNYLIKFKPLKRNNIKSPIYTHLIVIKDYNFYICLNVLYFYGFYGPWPEAIGARNSFTRVFSSCKRNYKNKIEVDMQTLAELLVNISLYLSSVRELISYEETLIINLLNVTLYT